jgi:hypothetical protein
LYKLNKYVDVNNYIYKKVVSWIGLRTAILNFRKVSTFTESVFKAVPNTIGCELCVSLTLLSFELKSTIILLECALIVLVVISPVKLLALLVVLVCANLRLRTFKIALKAGSK